MKQFFGTVYLVMLLKPIVNILTNDLSELRV